MQSFESTQLAYGLGFCLSAERDLLSQWRGYTGDGAGVAIGFNRLYLEELTKANYEGLPLLSFCKVQYGDAVLRKEMDMYADDIVKLIKEGALDFDENNDIPNENKKFDEED